MVVDMTGFNSKRDAAADKLQEPEQEPVGTLNISRYKGHLVNHDFDYFGELPDGTYSVYTTPPLPVQPAQEPDDLTIAYQSGFYDGRKAALAKRKWAGMTDDEIKKICDCTHGYDADQRIAREVEAKLKEKNA